MKRRLLSLSVLVFGMVGLVFAEGVEPKTADRAAIPAVGGSRPVIMTHPVSGAPVTEVAGGGTARSEFLELDFSGAYSFSGYFKTAEPDRKARIWITITYYDAARTLLKPWSVWPMCGTETTLARDLKKGDLPEAHVPSDWVLSPPYLYAMAFHVQPDLSDLPNHSAVLMGRAVEQDYPAGTPIRLHRYVDFPGGGGVAVPVWNRYVFRVAGEAPLKEPARRIEGVQQFWSGTKYVRVEIRNRDRSSGTLLFDELLVHRE